MKKIALVAGAVANKPFNGGAAWTRMSWVLGLQQSGFDVYFIEQIREKDCVDAMGQTTDFEHSVNLQFFSLVTDLFGISGRAALITEDGSSLKGLNTKELSDLAPSAAFLLNISGHLKRPEIISEVPLRIYLDLDPGYTQIWQTQGYGSLGLEKHQLFFTIGENLGSAVCSIPTCGLMWRPTRQPAILDEWPFSSRGRHDWLTTVASWRGGYGQLTYRSQTYGPKAHEFRKLLSLPGRCNRRRFEVALDIHPSETESMELFRSHGWNIVNARTTAGDPRSFRAYVQSSGAEFSVAQNVYVQTNSGWFSDRTVRYLSSGKPALVQNTGFGRQIPTGEGLLAFSSMEEAVSGVERIYLDYSSHCRRAREIATQFFDSRRVLAKFLEEAGITA